METIALILYHRSQKKQEEISDFFVSFLYSLYYEVLSLVDFCSTSVCAKDTLCYIPQFSSVPSYISIVFAELRLTYYITASPKRKPRSSRLLDKPAASDYNTKKGSQMFSLHIAAIRSGKGFFHGTKNKTISAHNRCRSHAFCGAAAAFFRSGICCTAGRPGTAHSGRRHSGTIYQCAYDRAGKTAETPVLQGQKTALG